MSMIPVCYQKYLTFTQPDDITKIENTKANKTLCDWVEFTFERSQSISKK